MKIRILFFSIALYFVSILFSCNNRENDYLKTRLEHMETLQIKVPFQDMVRLKNSDIVEKEYDYDSAEFKLIVYTDSLECNVCAIKKLYDWNDYIKMSSNFNGKFVIRFIITVPTRKFEEVKKAYLFSNVQSPIYIDSTGIFMKHNPELPSEHIFHTFLLDKNDSIVLVGNPLNNSSIEDLFMNMLEESKRHNRK